MILQTLRSLLFNCILYISLIPTSLVVVFLFPFISTSQLQKITSIWVLFIMYSLKVICGVNWKVEGSENLPKTPCILASNHQGAWESFFLQTLCIPTASIIKKELLYIPFFGWALACLKPIYLKRSQKVSSLKKVVKDSAKKLKNGTSLIIFPEGTRTIPEKGLKKFTNSCGLISVQNNVPIVPICHNSGLFWKNKKFTKEKGTVILRIGAPIHGKEPKKVTQEVFEWINLNFNEIN